MLDTVTIRQSHKHPTLCTLTVDGYERGIEGAGGISKGENQWRLPNTDPRNEGKYLFRLHTLDVYFWKKEDAHAFVAAAKQQLESTQVEVLDAPPSPASHEGLMSPVVQQLENVAVQDPAYHHGQTRNSQSSSTGLDSPQRDVSQDTARQQASNTPKPVDFQPLAYNPAAPAAPEPIKHREKTPPPIDGEDGTGLAGAAYRDHAQIVSPQSSLSQPTYGLPQNTQGFRGPHSPHSNAPNFASPTPSAGSLYSPSTVQGQRTSSVSSFPPPPPPQSGRGSVSPYTPVPSFAPPPHIGQNPAPEQTQNVASAFSAPPQDQSQTPFYRQDTYPQESPATEILGNSYVSGVRQPLQHLQPQYANYTPSPPAQEAPERMGEYSKYQYDQQQPQHHHHQHHMQPQESEYDIHNQVYRPTQEEASKHKPSKAPTAAPGSPTGRLEQGAGRVDKKVNSLFKRLEKRIG